MDRNHAQASQTLLTRILELHTSGRTADEIATQVLTTEPENAMFRAAMLVEIILHYARRCTEEKN
jgi:16S rRNA C1402 N4-methylase RsmH